MVVGENTIVVLYYVQKDNEGKILDDTYKYTPLRYNYGENDLPIGVRKAIMGLKPGEKKAISVSAEAGFGTRKQDSIVKIHKNDLPDNVNYEVGKRYRRFDKGFNYHSFVLIGYIDDWVFLDGNHPFAGMNLCYEVHILDVIPA